MFRDDYGLQIPIFRPPRRLKESFFERKGKVIAERKACKMMLEREEPKGNTDISWRNPRMSSFPLKARQNGGRSSSC
jgi:hypothetical protein